MKNDLLLRKLLFIYQMPKTGSQTVEATLQKCSLPHRIFRFHYLGPEMASRAKEAIHSSQASQTWKQSATRQLEMAGRLNKAIRIRKFLRRCGLPIPKLEVITGVRDLIGLALSSVFQNSAYFAPNGEELNIEVCRETLLHGTMFRGLENWFDWELKLMLGIDVYQTVFPRQKGYTLFENHYARVLLYRMESLPNLPIMLREFLRCEVPEVIHRNVGSAKGYADQYAYVREHLRLPPAFVAERYQTQIMKHFYSIKERKAFAARWSEEPWKTDVGLAAAVCKV